MGETLGTLGHTSQPLWSKSMADGFIVRSVGVSGTYYASSALTAATSIYFFILKRRWLFIISFSLLVIWGVGSSLVAAIAYILWLKRKSKMSIIFFVVGLSLVFVIITNRGDFSSVLYLPKADNIGAFDFLMASIIGEGKSISSLHSEVRILGLFFSLGAIGALLISILIINYRNFARYASLNNLPNFKAGLGFIIVLLLATFHYNTFFVFPNIFLIVMLMVFSSIGFMRIPKCD